jgi:hypothetical protein
MTLWRRIFWLCIYDTPQNKAKWSQMCGRFETRPSLQTLVGTLKKHKVDLLIELDSEKRKTENIAPANKIFSITKSYLLFPWPLS